MPEAIAVGSQVSITLTGSKLELVNLVSIEPASNITVSGPPAVNGTGTELTFTLDVVNGAAIGQRSIILEGFFEGQLVLDQLLEITL